MKLKLMLKCSLKLVSQPRTINPLLGVSPLELEVLLDRSQNPELEKSSTQVADLSYRNKLYYPIFANARHVQIGTKELLQSPQIFVDQTDSGFSVTYNQELKERVNQKIHELRRGREDDKNLEKMVNLLLIDREWIEETQLAIVRYLCQSQTYYINSGNPFDFNPLTQKEIGEQFSYSPSTISRLIKNLTTRMPNAKVIFASELIPSRSQNSLKVGYALEQLAKNAAYFREGAWQVTDSRITKILQQTYGLTLTRRRVSRYTLEFQNNYRIV